MKVTPASVRAYYGRGSSKSVKSTPKNTSQPLRQNGKNLDVKG